MTLRTLSLALATVFLYVAQSWAMVKTYPDKHKGVKESDIYEVTVHQNGEVYQTFVYRSDARTEGPGTNWVVGRTMSWAQFDFTGTVFVEVKILDKERAMKGEPKIYPTRYGIDPEWISDDTIRFQVSHAKQYVVEFGPDSKYHGLVIFADPMEVGVPDKNSKKVFVYDNTPLGKLDKKLEGKDTVYFENGVWNLGVEFVLPPQIREVYIEGGAVVYGMFEVQHDNVKIYGRGVVNGDPFPHRAGHMIESPNYVKNTIVDGVTVSDFPQFAVRLLGQDSTINNVKTVGAWIYNADGLVAWERSTMSNCFVQADDDAIKVYDTGVSISDCVIWQVTNGACLQLGWESLEIYNAHVRNIDIVYTEWDRGMRAPGGGSPNNSVINLRLNTGGSKIQQNVVFENIIVENPTTRLIDLRMKDQDTRGSGGEHKMKDFVFRNITANFVDYENKDVGNFMTPYSEEWGYKNIVFENLVIDGEKITADNAETVGRFRFKGNAKENVTFK